MNSNKKISVISILIIELNSNILKKINLLSIFSTAGISSSLIIGIETCYKLSFVDIVFIDELSLRCTKKKKERKISPCMTLFTCEQK